MTQAYNHILTGGRNKPTETRQKKANFSRANKFRSQTQVSKAGPPYVIFDLNSWRIVNVNEAASKLYDYSSSELIGKPLSLLFRSDLDPKLMASLLERKGSDSLENIWEHRTRTGTRFFVEIEAECFEDRKRRRRCALSIQGFSKAAGLEQALDRATSRYESLFNYAREGIFQSTPDGKLLSANPAFAYILGYPNPEEAIQDLQPLEKRLYVDPTQRSTFKKILDERGSVIGLEIQAYRKDRSRIWLSCNARSVKDRGGNTLYYEGFVQDITAEKVAKDKLDWALRDLKRSNEDLERFAYMASHDLQEPLRTVASYVGLLRAKYGGQLDSKADLFIDYAISGATRMKRLIQDLLSYSQINREPKDFRKVNLNTVLDEALKELSRPLEDSVILRRESLPQVFCDPTQIRRVFVNLLRNALRYRSPRRPLEVCIRARPDPSQTVIEIADNGVGFEMRFAEKVFEPFGRLQSVERAGSGLGLAICHLIITRHGGRIWASAKPDEGASFFFALPRSNSNQREACSYPRLRPTQP